MFDFFSVPRIVFGPGKVVALAELVGPLGPTVLVAYNGGETPLARVSDVIRPTGVAVVPHRQKGEPTVADVDAALEVARRAACTGVVGVGGGSAIDLAKAVAGLLANGGSALDYMEVIGKGQKFARPAVPWVAVPTTAGTGAEVTRNAVVGEPSRKFKASLRSELLLARAAVVDPELGLDVPPNVTAWSGMDALCQCVESYVSTGANAMTDGLALEGIKLAARSLRRAFADGHDVAARSDMALAALISGVTLTNAGLGAVHGFAAPIGANFPAPHGAVCAALLAPVTAANVVALRTEREDHPTLGKYAAVGRALEGDERLPRAEALDAAARVPAELSRALSVPPLSTFGMSSSDVPEMVALARKASSMRFNPVALGDDVLSDVLGRAIEG